MRDKYVFESFVFLKLAFVSLLNCLFSEYAHWYNQGQTELEFAHVSDAGGGEATSDKNRNFSAPQLALSMQLRVRLCRNDNAHCWFVVYLREEKSMCQFE